MSFNVLSRLNVVVLFFVMFVPGLLCSQPISIALLKYRGGGDWYANPTSLPNLVKFCNQELHTELNTNIATVDVGSPDIFNYPFVHATGHGNITFSDAEAANLRKYLLAGGFLHIDDNYGIKDFVMREMKKVLNNVIKTLLVIFRAVLRLHDRPVPYRAVDIIEFTADYLSFNKIVLSKLAKVKYENDDYTKQELIFIEAELLKDIQNMLKQVDAMHF